MSNTGERTDKQQSGEELHPTSFIRSAKNAGSQIGRFRIERHLSSGPMGVVYLAHDTKLDRPVAIKSLPPEVMDKPLVRERFQREARVLASLNHRNIAVIYEELEEAEGVDYMVLEYVPGVTLADQIAGGGLKLNVALSIAVQIAEAISAAHEKGIIHRDLKPSNIKITPEGTVKVLDFGIAKLISGEPLDQQSTAVTQPGQVIGTPGYMSPEQAFGKVIDHRSDIWSFGCVLYEMLTGMRPFPGKTTSDMLESILKAEPDWESLPKEVPPVIHDIIRKCLEKDPQQRYQSAAEIHQDLVYYQETLTLPVPKAVDLKALLRLFRKPRVAVCSVVVFLLLCIVAYWLINRSTKVRWARVEALPEIERLIEQDKYLAAFSLAQKAGKYIPKDPMLIKLWQRMSRDFSIVMTPPGADIFFKEYSAIDSQWQYLGKSPLENIRFPRGLYRWKIAKEGFETIECLAGGWTDAPKPLNLELWEEGKFPPGMVRIPAGPLEVRIYALDLEGGIEAQVYLIDKYEVTNEQFKKFVEAGGYEKQDYWKQKFIKDGQELSWQEAMRQFRDRTGRAGPSTWEGVTYPKGQEKYPVSGVCWYEAAAYAEFMGKSLPTIYHWSTAACSDETIAIIPMSNFGTEGPASVGSHPGIGRTGLYDMAGNVKEWCWNATDDSMDQRYILGGAWGEPTYMFADREARSVWDRSQLNGFRCVQYPNSQEGVPDALFRPIKLPLVRDFSRETPASEEEFQFYKKLYAYDRIKLNAKVISVDESSDYWRSETITFDAAYGGERVTAELFLPKGTKPPYQTVVFFPGWGAFVRTGLDHPDSYFWDFIIMSGRAFMYPVYKGTLKRQILGAPPGYDKPNAYRDWTIQLSKDMGRSVDYLESRNDIDHGKIAYYGVSMGARLGPIMMAMEDRFKAGVFAVGGFSTFATPPPPEADPFNFAPRVKVPVLMVNGKEDTLFPLKASQIPMYELLGASDEDKKHVLYPGGHGLFGLFIRQIRGDVLGWLDRYLGPVD